MKKYPTKIKLILHFLKGSKRYFALSMLFAVLASLLDMVNPRIISFVVDSVIGDKVSSLPAAVNRLLETWFFFMSYEVVPAEPPAGLWKD